jgi:hypothetical protein
MIMPQISLLGEERLGRHERSHEVVGGRCTPWSAYAPSLAARLSLFFHACSLTRCSSTRFLIYSCILLHDGSTPPRPAWCNAHCNRLPFPVPNKYMLRSHIAKVSMSNASLQFDSLTREKVLLNGVIDACPAILIYSIYIHGAFYSMTRFAPCLWTANERSIHPYVVHSSWNRI